MKIQKHMATDGKKPITPSGNYKIRLPLLPYIFGSFPGAAKTAPQRQGTFLSRGLPGCHEQASSGPERLLKKLDSLTIRVESGKEQGRSIVSSSRGGNHLKGLLYEPLIEFVQKRLKLFKGVHTAHLKGLTCVPWNFMGNFFRPIGEKISSSVTHSHAVVVPSVGGFAHVL